MRKRHPKFQRPNLSVNKRVKNKWRKPRGIDSKQRQKIKWAGAVVNKGYGNDSRKRHLHPQGKPEFRIRNSAEFERYKQILPNYVVRLQGSISKRNKELIRKRAEELGVKVLN